MGEDVRKTLPSILHQMIIYVHPRCMPSGEDMEDFYSYPVASGRIHMHYTQWLGGFLIISKGSDSRHKKRAPERHGHI